ncbi:MAG: hypothetical protein QOD82_469 [Pseudonocardiales bacterium]|nr:hypothetical protein [Pseudonocardiales bacterium]
MGGLCGGELGRRQPGWSGRAAEANATRCRGGRHLNPVDNSAATPRTFRGRRARCEVRNVHGRCATWCRKGRGNHATCAGIGARKVRGASAALVTGVKPAAQTMSVRHRRCKVCADRGRSVRARGGSAHYGGPVPARRPAPRVRHRRCTGCGPASAARCTGCGPASAARRTGCGPTSAARRTGCGPTSAARCTGAVAAAATECGSVVQAAEYPEVSAGADGRRGVAGLDRPAGFPDRLGQLGELVR